MAITKTDLRNEIVSKKETAYNAIGENVKKYNSLLLDETTSHDDIAKLMSDIDGLVKEYNKQAETLCYFDLSETANIMLEAVKKLTFETIKVKENKKEEPHTLSSEYRDKYIDLAKLDDYCRHGIGATPEWKHKAERLNLLLTAKIATDIDASTDLTTINDCFTMSKINKEYKVNKNMFSNTRILSELTEVIQAMLGTVSTIQATDKEGNPKLDEEGNPVYKEYKALKVDREYLLNAFSKQSRSALKIATSNHKGMNNILLNICHRIALNTRYDVESKLIKLKKS
jgi:hypothetical protein